MSNVGWLRSALAATVSVFFFVVAGSCAADGPTRSLSPAAESGRQLARSNGCAACHGTNGQGGVGTAFVGLAGSRVELVDGTFVTADDAYIVRSIVDPSADLVAGFDLRMPNNDLSESEIADIVTYIKELAGE